MSGTALKDSVKLHFLVLLWGFAAILGQMTSLPFVEIVFHRTLLSALALFILLKLRGFRLEVEGRELRKIIGVGIIMGIHWVLFFASVKVSNVSVCLVGMATTSLWTSFIEPMFFRRRIAIHEVLLGIMVLVGIGVIFRFETGYVLGLSLAIMSAMLAAVFTVLNGQIIKRYHHHVITFYQMGSACLTVTIILLFNGIVLDQTVKLVPVGWDWVYLVALALVCTVYAWSEFFELMKRMTPFAVNLVLNLEPVYGMIFAFLIFGQKERMELEFYAGALILLLSIFIYPLMQKRSYVGSDR